MNHPATILLLLALASSAHATESESLDPRATGGAAPSPSAWELGSPKADASPVGDSTSFSALQRVSLTGADAGFALNASASPLSWLTLRAGLYTDTLIEGGSIGLRGGALIESTDSVYGAIRLDAGAHDAGAAVSPGEWASTGVRIGWRGSSEHARGGTWLDLASTWPGATLYWHGELTLIPTDWLELRGAGTWTINRDGAGIGVDLSAAFVHRETGLRVIVGLLMGALPVWLGRGVPLGVEPGDGAIYVAMEVRG